MSMHTGVLSSGRWRRLIPIAFITYSFAYLDRSNYSLGAAAGLGRSLHITSGETGLLGGLFFIGYFIFQVPAAGFAERRSVKTLMFWSLLAWGILAAAQGVIPWFWLFLIDRFLLGVVEAAVIPAMLVFLNHWFSDSERGRADTLLILGNPVTGLPRLIADKKDRHWDHYPVSELAGRTLPIVGLGSIGTEVARLGKAFGMHTIGVNRQGVSDSPHVDEAHPSADLKRILADADAVVLALPLTEETEGLLDAEAIAKMRPGAAIVNVGRGGVIDEAALVDGLRHGRLGGAALDVFATEPLPATAPFGLFRTCS